MGFKGKAEQKETIDQTALREVEETGVEGLSNKTLEITYHILKEMSNISSKTYWFEMFSDYIGDFKPQKKGDYQVKWVGPKN